MIKDAAPRLIWTYLAYKCHDKAALAFLSQWKESQNTTKDGVAMETETEELSSPLWTTLDHRKCTLPAR